MFDIVKIRVARARVKRFKRVKFAVGRLTRCPGVREQCSGSQFESGEVDERP